MRNAWIYLLFTLIIGLSPVYYVWQSIEPAGIEDQQAYGYVEFVHLEHKQVKVGEEFNIKACKIVDGYIFEVLLDNDLWIEAHLTTATKDDAAPLVAELVRMSTFPSVVLKRKVGDFWIVDFNLTVAEKRINMMEWLKLKGFAL
jgi:hypothetical protein